VQWSFFECFGSYLKAGKKGVRSNGCDVSFLLFFAKIEKAPQNARPFYFCKADILNQKLIFLSKK